MDQCIAAISASDAPDREPVLVELSLYPNARTPELFLLREALDNRGGQISREMSIALLQEVQQQCGQWRFESGGRSLYLYFHHPSIGVWLQYELTVSEDLGLHGRLCGAVCQFVLEDKVSECLARSFDENVRQAVNDLTFLEYRRMQGALWDRQGDRFFRKLASEFDRWRRKQEPETQQQALALLAERRAYWQAQAAEKEPLMHARRGVCGAERPGREPVAFELLTCTAEAAPDIFVLRETPENRGGPLSEAMIEVVAEHLHERGELWRGGARLHTLYAYNARSGIFDEYGLGRVDGQGPHCEWVNEAASYEVEKALGGASLARSRSEYLRQCAHDVAYMERRQVWSLAAAVSNWLLPDEQSRREGQRFSAFQQFERKLHAWLEQEGAAAWTQFLDDLRDQRAWLREQRAAARLNPYRRS